MPNRRSSLSLRAACALLLSLQSICSPVLLAQQRNTPRQPKQPAAPRPTLQQELAAAINELLKLEPVRAADVAAMAEAVAAAQEENAKPPAADAPLKELIVYWQNRGADERAVKPSERVRERLLEACEARPWLLPRLLGLLPESEGAKDRLFKLYQNEPGEEEQWKTQLRQWLKYNTRHFLDELRAEARGAATRGEDENSAQTFLARLDWETARPLLEASPNPLALVTLFEHATTRGELTLAESCRTRLKAIVNDRNAGELRLLAMQSLLKTEWPGQEDWFVSLFTNSSLNGAEALMLARRELEEELSQQSANKSAERPSFMAKLAMGLPLDKGASPQNMLALAMNTCGKRFVPAVLKLVGHSDRQIHNAAVEALGAFLEAEETETEEALSVARALLPWLADPQWSDSFSRLTYIGMLSRIKVPESVTGLIAVLDNDEEPLTRAAAAEALSKQRNASAAPALRRALEREEDESFRESLVTALFLCGGITDEEAAAAVEAYARKLAAPGGAEAITKAKESEVAEPLPLKISIGRILNESDRLVVTEGLATLLFERVKALRTKEPEVARQILNVVQGAPLPVAQQFLARRIGEGWVDVEALTLALETRSEMQKNAGGELSALLNRAGYAAGTAAVVLNDAEAARALLKGKDDQARLALLACARYLRDALPLELIADLLADKALGNAAESYLIVEDSAAARQLVWARHPGEALILGDHLSVRTSKVTTHSPPNSMLEEAFRRELLQPVKGSAAIFTEIHVFFSPRLIPRWEIRIRADQTELRKYADHSGARWYARALIPSELTELRALTKRLEAEELKPLDALEDISEGAYEYLRLDRDSGRRILTGAPHRVGRNATLHEELSGLFYRLSHSGEFKVRYAIEEKLPGVEVVLAESDKHLATVCQESGELRVLSTKAGKVGAVPAEDWQPEWRAVVNGQLGGPTNEPAACRLSNLFSAEQRMRRSRFGLEDTPQIGKDGSLVFARPYGDEPGIWRVLPGGEPEKLREGRYFAPLLTPEGQWLLAVRANSAGVGAPSQLIRYHLKTRQELVINLPKEIQLQPLAYVEAHGKVLLGRSQYGFGAWSPTSQQSHFLLDLNSGALQPVQGDFRPLYEPTWRPLQATGKPHEFWLALTNREEGSTAVGRYDSRSFVFQPVLTLPGLHIRSEEMWVDAAANRLWLIYQGHLLRLPLTNDQPSKERSRQ
jgi:hypothetical protein